MLPLPSLTVNVFVLMVEDCIASLNVAVMALLITTPAAPLAGLVELTVGGSASPVVVKLQVLSLSSDVPAKFAALAPVVIVAVYVVLGDRLLEGVNMAVAAFVVTTPGTSPPPPLSLKVLVFKVDPFINMEKVADTYVLTATPAAPLAGLVEFIVRVTLGGGSGGGAEVVVVKDASLPVDVP